MNNSFEGPEGMGNLGEPEKQARTVPTAEEQQRCDDWLKDHPEYDQVEAPRDYEVEKAECIRLIDEFEAKHDLAALNPIVSKDEALSNPKRASARDDLAPIVGILNGLKRRNSIPESEYEALRARYRKLSQAVGMINGNTLDHTR